jgi:putative two-component system response regulator
MVRRRAGTWSIHVDRDSPAVATILMVDDEPANIDIVTRVLAPEGYRVSSARDGEEGLSAVRRTHPDVVLLDVVMPGLDGFEVCRRLKDDAVTRLIPVVLVTTLGDRDARIRGAASGADDFLSKPIDVLELKARLRSLVRLKRFTDELESAESVILSLALTIEARDPATDGHCERLARYATALGAAVGLGQVDLEALRRGGFLHDVGKVGIPDAILLKRGPLIPSEFRLMKTHTLIGERLCGSLRSLEKVRPIIRHHHERLDGSGYPDGLKGAGVPLLAQVIGIVDVFDALTTDRPYRAAQSAARAREELRDEVRRGWRDGALVESFLTIARA